MILYKCKCGEELPMTDNSEQGRKAKRDWKQAHYHSNEKLNPGHGFLRLVITKKKGGFQ